MNSMGQKGTSVVVNVAKTILEIPVSQTDTLKHHRWGLFQMGKVHMVQWIWLVMSKNGFPIGMMSTREETQTWVHNRNIMAKNIKS
jgi:hypothetical protein